MATYLSLYLSLIGAYFLGYLKNFDRKISFWIMSFIIIAIPAFREKSVGTDTIEYINFFLRPQDGYYGLKVEGLFEMWNYFLRCIWKNIYFYLFINSVITLSCIVFFIHKNSRNPILSLLIFVLIGDEMYFMHFAAMRQSLAIGFFLVSLYFYNRNRDYDKYISLLLYILAFLFHTSVAYCFLVVLIFSKINIEKKSAYILLGLSFIIGASGIMTYDTFFTGVLGNINNYYSMFERYNSYTTEGDWSSSSHRIIMDMIPPTLFCSLCYWQAKKIHIKNLFLKLFLFGVVLGNIFSSFMMAFRLVIYFKILYIIALPLVFRQNNKYSKFIIPLFILYYFYKSYAILMGLENATDGNIVIPYKSFLF